jgi:N-acyl-L-homoserine lactone synthetase
MRVEVIEPAGRADRHALLTRAFALRHDTFVEDRGWEMLRRPDALDIDEHDFGAAIHFLALEAERVVGYVRLLAGHCDLVAARADPVRVRETVGDVAVNTVSRFCVDRNSAARKSVVGNLLVTTLQYAEKRAVGALLFGTDSGLIFVLRSIGLHLEAAGAPVDIAGRTHQSVLLRLDATVLPAVRRNLSTWNRISNGEPVLVMPGDLGRPAAPLRAGRGR